MLDTSSRTYTRLVIGKSPIFGLWDFPVQHVTPSWSPDENQIVFGGWTFPLEIYDLQKSKQKILTGPHYSLHSAQWSPSGKWIAAIQSGDELDRLYIFSPDGSLHSATQECELISDFQWAPEETRLCLHAMVTTIHCALNHVIMFVKIIVMIPVLMYVPRVTIFGFGILNNRLYAT